MGRTTIETFVKNYRGGTVPDNPAIDVTIEVSDSDRERAHAVADMLSAAVEAQFDAIDDA